MDQLEKIQPATTEKYLPIIRDVFQKISQKELFQYGNVKYSGLDDETHRGENRGWDWKNQYPIDFL